MISFDWKKNIEDSIKHGPMIILTTTRIFIALKAVNLKPTKPSLDAKNIIKFAIVICGGVLVKDYAVYKKWINE